MASRRMFSLDVIDTDKFLEMPASSQSLYFHLGMRADDDGFVSSPKKIACMVNCSNDDLKILIAKEYLIPFTNGVVIITDWKMNNYIQKDRYHPTRYQKEFKSLIIEDGVYKLYTKSIQFVNKTDTEVRLELGKSKDNNTTCNEIDSSKVQDIIQRWNALGLQKIMAINKGTKRYELLNHRINEYGYEKVVQAIENINQSNFLKGHGKNNWTIAFDWFVQHDNFIKVLEENYNDKNIEIKRHNKKLEEWASE